MKILESKKNKDTYDFVVQVDKNAWEAEQLKALNALSKNVKIDGFRKGKVPKTEAIKRINPMDVFDRALNKIISPTAVALVDSKEFKKVEDDLLDISPKVEVSKVEKDNLELKFTYTLYPDVKVDGYKDIKVKAKLEKVTDEILKKEIDGYLEKNAMTVPKNGPIAKGDIVTFDFKGFVDKKPFQGGEAKNYELKIGSGQFIPGFEDQMIGLKEKDEKTISVKFPKDYHEKSLANKDAEFEITIHSVSEIEKAELNDEYIKSLNIKDVATVDSFKKYLKENLEKTYKQRYEYDAKLEILNEIGKLTKVSNLPKELIEQEKTKITNALQQQIQMYGMSIDQYISMLGMSKEDFDKKHAEQAKLNCHISFGMLKITEIEKIEPTEKEIDAEIEKVSKTYGITKEELMKRINNDTSFVESMLTEDKVINLILKKNK
ncbi:trigger factor [Malacoplasma iowae]|uniref:trigger factor n=1 Tax=Malacoplasma iowae TaxID=2116 RepID=UPI003873B223|nr:trigger factor [Malacoplasma iowae]